MTAQQFDALPDHVKVKLDGKEYWLHGHHLLSPLEHFDESGNLTPDARGSISYAVIESGGAVKRYRQTIANITNLEAI